MKSIAFVLPQYPLHIAGGYKIVFEYANKLVEDNFKVSIIFLNNDAPHFLKAPQVVKRIIMNIVTHKKINWFKLDSRINIVSSTQCKFLKKIKNVDVAVATAAITVKPTDRLFPNIQKAYLIQGYETWDMDKSDLKKTYNSGFHNITVSKWLSSIVEKATGEKPTYIRNPIDTSAFKSKISINKRNKFKIGMLYHMDPYKGSKIALDAIYKVKKQYPQVQLIMFGSCNPPANLPSWIKYYKNATQDEVIKIYNEVSIFVCGTIEEGFGLTGLESMACGDVLVSTNYLGVHEYAVNEKNALLSPIKDSNKLAENIGKVINDNDLRFKLSNNGIKTASKFSLIQSYEKLRKAIISNQN